MNGREKFISDVDSQLKKYKAKISKIDDMLKHYNSSNKNKVMEGGQAIKEKFQEAQNFFDELKSSTKENVEDLKLSFSSIMDSLTKSFEEFGQLLSLDELAELKEGVADYSREQMAKMSAFGREKVIEMEEYVKHNPISVIAGAVGVGILIGIVISRMNKNV